MKPYLVTFDNRRSGDEDFQMTYDLGSAHAELCKKKVIRIF
jgi:hypothetical protein